MIVIEDVLEVLEDLMISGGGGAGWVECDGGGGEDFLSDGGDDGGENDYPGHNNGFAPDEYYYLLYVLTRLYGPHIVIFATLSAITVYRREMSCNRCYFEEEQQHRGPRFVRGDDGGEEEGAEEEEEGESPEEEEQGGSAAEVVVASPSPSSLEPAMPSLMAVTEASETPSIGTLVEKLLSCVANGGGDDDDDEEFVVNQEEKDDGGGGGGETSAEAALEELLEDAGMYSGVPSSFLLTVWMSFVDLLFQQKKRRRGERRHPGEGEGGTAGHFFSGVTSSSLLQATVGDGEDGGKCRRPLRSVVEGAPHRRLPPLRTLTSLSSFSFSSSSIEDEGEDSDAAALAEGADADAATAVPPAAGGRAASPEAAQIPSPRRRRDAAAVKSLPPDAVVHALSFLHPADVVSFGCVSRACRQIVDPPRPTPDAGKGEQHEQDQHDDDTHSVLWKKLWLRDYGWAVRSWSVGRAALERSASQYAAAAGTTAAAAEDLLSNGSVRYSKDFYYAFRLSWVNYALAGRNGPDSCLVGLRGHVYDMTDFLSSHPGSPETVMVYAGGKDATTFFDSVRHSRSAKKLARSMCVVVDDAAAAAAATDDNDDGGGETSPPNYYIGCGLKPTKLTPIEEPTGDRRGGLQVGGGDDDADARAPPRVEPPADEDPAAAETVPLARGNGDGEDPAVRGRPHEGTRRSASAMLQSARSRYEREEKSALQRAGKHPSREDSLCSEINVYYDPFSGSWKAWYTDAGTFDNVYLQEI